MTLIRIIILTKKPKKRGFVINYENPKLSENINNPKYDKGIYYLRTVANSRFNPRN